MRQLPQVINLEGFEYIGRERGERLRATLKLDELDAKGEEVEVAISNDTFVISSSFFLGLFGPSVVRAGSKDGFCTRYHFRFPFFMKDVIDGYVDRALQTPIAPAAQLSE